MNVILACDEQYGIGMECGLPWNVPEDLRKFKELTKGDGNNVVIMGKNTFDTFSKPLPGRINIVVSKTLYHIHIDKQLRGFYIMPTLNDAIKFSEDYVQSKNGNIWIIGGAQIYDSVFKDYIVKNIYLTKIKGTYKCDVRLHKDTIEHLRSKKWKTIDTNSSCDFLMS